MRPLRVRSGFGFLACALVLPVLTACGGGGSTPITPPPPPPPPPVTSSIAPGTSVPTQGYSGGTFTFTFGAGVPAGETFTVGPTAKPVPPTCPPDIPTCLLVEQPVDALVVSVAASPLPVSAIANVALRGFSLQSASFTLVDATVDEGTTSFASTPTGGPLVQTQTFPSGTAPIATLQPNRIYVLKLWAHASLPPP